MPIRIPLPDDFPKGRHNLTQEDVKAGYDEAEMRYNTKPEDVIHYVLPKGVLIQYNPYDKTTYYKEGDVIKEQWWGAYVIRRLLEEHGIVLEIPDE